MNVIYHENLVDNIDLEYEILVFKYIVKHYCKYHPWM